MWQILKEEVRMQEAFFDAEIGEWLENHGASGGRIFCARGCSACCSLAVNTTLVEALRIADALTDGQVARIAERADRLREISAGAPDLKSYLRQHRRLPGGCPLLAANGSCGVYGVRPFSCRALLATRESRWCAADFAELSPEEKRLFVESLDPAVAAFPMHYVAATQRLGEELEALAAGRMAAVFGFAIYGNLAVLVHLEREHRLSAAVAAGATETERLLARTGFDHPFLVTRQEAEPPR